MTTCSYGLWDAGLRWVLFMRYSSYSVSTLWIRYLPDPYKQKRKTCHVHLINVGHSCGLQLLDIPLWVGSWHCGMGGYKEMYIYCEMPCNKSQKKKKKLVPTSTYAYSVCITAKLRDAQMYTYSCSRCLVAWGLELDIGGREGCDAGGRVRGRQNNILNENI